MFSEDQSISDAPVFDEREALARTGNDRELFGEMAQMVLADLPDALEGIKNALAVHDQEALHRLTHNLKGHLSAVGCGPVVEAARDLDARARAGEIVQARTAYAVLLREVERLRAVLATWLRENRNEPEA